MNEVDITVKATDQSSGVLGTIGAAWDSTAKKIGGAVTTLGHQIGGELGDLVSSAGEAITKLGESGTNAGTKLAAAGAGVAAFGIALTALGSKEQQASQQLDQAIINAGQSVSDYSKQIEEAVNQGENFGHSASDVESALQILTTATGDTATALQYMGLVEDIAAAKHESLAAAAQQVSLVLAGNTKVLKQFGINLGTGTHSVEELQNALTLLAAKEQGQAAAASDTFMGRLDALKEHALGLASSIGQTVGPALAFAGTVMGIVGAGLDIHAAKLTRAAAAETALAASELEAGSAAAAAVPETAALTAANDGLAASAEGASVAMGTRGLIGTAAASIGPLGLAVTAVAGLGLGLDYLQQKMANFITGASGGKDTRSVWDKITGFFSTAPSVSDVQKSGALGAPDSTGKSDSTSVAAAQAALAATATQAVMPITSLTTELQASAAAQADTANKTQIAYLAMVQEGDTADLLNQALQGLNNQILSTAEAQTNLYADTLTNTKALTDNKTKVVDGSKASIGAQQAIENQARAIQALMTANINGGMSTQKATDLANQQGAAFLQQIAKTDGAKSAVYAYAQQILGIPAAAQTTMTVDDAAALAKIASYKAQINALNAGKTIGNQAPSAPGLDPAENAHGGVFGGAATGGARHGLTWVGEHGPELVRLPSGSYVNSNPDSMRIANQGGGNGWDGVIRFELVGGDAELRAWFRKSVRINGGGDVQKAFGTG